MIVWMREMKVTLTSSSLQKKMTFGTAEKVGNNSLTISIDGYKYLSALKDNFTVKITNLTYAEVTELISGQFYDIKIEAGYRSIALHTIFVGSVLYISNNVNDRKTNTVIILCASRLVAAYGQSRMNLSLSSGINMYSAIKFLCERAGIKNSNVDETFKNRIIRESSEVTSTLGSYIDIFTKSNNFIVNSDSSFGTDISIWNPYNHDTRVLILTAESIILTSGYPTISSDGLKVTAMPTFNFMPGDTIKLDNSLVNLGASSKEEAFQNMGYFLDKEGKYMIYELEYHLENRESNFSVQMLCKSKSLISKIAGVEGFKNGN